MTNQVTGFELRPSGNGHAEITTGRRIDERCPACGDQERQEYIGHLWNRPHMVHRCLVCQCLYQIPNGKEVLSALSEAERTIMRLTAEGCVNKQIAKQCEISVRTVHLRRSALLRKLGVKTRAELIGKAHELGLLQNQPLADVPLPAAALNGQAENGNYTR